MFTIVATSTRLLGGAGRCQPEASFAMDLDSGSIFHTGGASRGWGRGCAPEAIARRRGEFRSLPSCYA